MSVWEELREIYSISQTHDVLVDDCKAENDDFQDQENDNKDAVLWKISKRKLNKNLKRKLN